MEQVPNLFKLYHDFTKRSEPPPNFHAWSAIGMISALLGKKCYIPQGHFTVFPNLYIVLVGDAGTRKTTAMDIAGNLLRLTSVPMAPDSATRESLIDDMAKNVVHTKVGNRPIDYWQSTAFVSELHEFLGGQHINRQMVMFLTAIWDRPVYKERTRKGGEVVIKNPYFTLLGCCTPGWMSENLKQNLISDGFARRTIFCLENEIANSVAWPKLLDEVQLLPLLKAQIQRINKMGGEFQLSKEALQLYIDTYPTFREEAKNHSEKIGSYFSSKHVLALKICMCLSAALRNDYVVDTEILKLSFKFLSETEKTLDKVFSNIGRNELKAILNNVVDIIQASPKGLTKEEIYAAGIYDNANLQEFDEVLNVLMESGIAEAKCETFAGKPVFRLLKSVKPAKALNLLELAGRTVVSASETSSDPTPVGQEYRLDPIAEQLAVRQTVAEAAHGRGILFQGKMSKLLGKAETPSESEEDMSDV